MLQNYALFVPKESQHNIPCWCFFSKLLWFWWWGMALFLARSLRFRLVEVNPGFVPSNDSCKEAITFSFKRRRSSSQASTRRSLNSGVSCRGTHLADTLWNWSTSCTMWCAEPWLIFKHAAILFCHSVVFHHYGFNCSNVLLSHNSLCLTWARSIFHWSHTICELPTPFVELLLWQTCITVLKLHSLMNFNRFHTFTTKNRITEHCSSLVQVSKWGILLYIDTVTVLVHLHYAATYRPFCTLLVALLPTYRIIARNFDFLLQI